MKNGHGSVLYRPASADFSLDHRTAGRETCIRAAFDAINKQYCGTETVFHDSLGLSDARIVDFRNRVLTESEILSE